MLHPTTVLIPIEGRSRLFSHRSIDLYSALFSIRGALRSGDIDDFLLEKKRYQLEQSKKLVLDALGVSWYEERKGVGIKNLACTNGTLRDCLYYAQLKGLEALLIDKINHPHSCKQILQFLNARFNKAAPEEILDTLYWSLEELEGNMLLQGFSLNP